MDKRGKYIRFLVVSGALCLVLFVSVARLPVAHARPDTTMAYWNFDEGTGIIAHDSSGNGNDGVITGATWTTGVSGDALYFDGSSYVTIPYSSSLDATGIISFQAWIKFDDFNNNYEVFLTKCSTDISTRNYVFYKNLSGDIGQLSFYSSDVSGGTELCDPSGWIATNDTWYFITIELDSMNNKCYFYVDSILKSTVDSSGGSPVGDVGETTVIGAYQVDIYDFHGSMDEVALYDYLVIAPPAPSPTLPLPLRTNSDNGEWVVISDYTLQENANSVDITIPENYDYLQLKMMTSGVQFGVMRFNDDDNYDYMYYSTEWRHDLSKETVDDTTLSLPSSYFYLVAAFGNVYPSSIIQLTLNIYNTENALKTVESDPFVVMVDLNTGGAKYYLDEMQISGVWLNHFERINKITIYMTGTNYPSGSRFTLLGLQIPSGIIAGVGPQGPPGENGAVGPQGPPGENGTNGTNGINGENGSRWYSGTGLASSGLGKDNDYYLENVSDNVYIKIGGSWVYDNVNLMGLIGPQGSQGPKGDNGATGPQGPQGIPGENGTSIIENSYLPDNSTIIIIDNKLAVSSDISDASNWAFMGIALAIAMPFIVVVARRKNGNNHS